MHTILKFALALIILTEFSNCKSAPQPADILVQEDMEAPEETPHNDEIPAEEIEYEIPFPDEKLPESSFNEVWAYMASNRERDFKSHYPISDIVYFAAEIDVYGRLTGVPSRKNIPNFNGRSHLAIVCNSTGLTHFVIQSGTEARKQLISEILAAAGEYDGINIDMENVPAQDGEHFLSFLSEIRAGLGGKMLSVCVPGRTRAVGVYSYTAIAAIADRVFVMAYDEHWSGSKPGPVASMEWCKAVAEYGLHTAGPEKLIMGMPFYGRGWGDKSTSRALIHSTTEGLKRDHEVRDFRRVNGIPAFSYDVVVNVTVYYEDEYSLAARMQMYRGLGVQNAGFWRLGQETPTIWQLIKLSPKR
ncbi:MAG: glycoside hydrolase [Spirochaetaceae bacterium]|jgi:spore germination protein YaaH|nr:glycoside hydrolase [Spirochaetaceae bacterium]